MMDSKNKRIKQMLTNFLMIFVPGLLIVTIFAGIFININIENGKNIIKIRQLNNSEIVGVNVNSIFEDIKSDGNIILNSSEIRAYVGNMTDANVQNELKRIFSNMMTNKKSMIPSGLSVSMATKKFGSMRSKMVPQQWQTVSWNIRAIRPIFRKGSSLIPAKFIFHRWI
ncbi:hypothetical protein ACWI_06450 [Acetobacterium wieringae]|uniref:Uncharacterized protein n=1 Tax=Acetobacterium wieringae TaxID=52694 RepID=A0A1F2PKP1_9FIRM|nr:hypothetical protein ACWI_06450 [Acetobacterium wieringae]